MLFFVRPDHIDFPTQTLHHRQCTTINYVQPGDLDRRVPAPCRLSDRSARRWTILALQPAVQRYWRMPPEPRPAN